MTRKIIGVTVGTPMNPQTIVDKSIQARQLDENTQNISELTNTVGELTQQINNIPPNPTKVSELENDKKYITLEEVPEGGASSWNDLQDKPTLGTLASKSTVAKTDLATDVQTSLGKADTALQSFTETDPTVPSWAKASTKPTYTASEVGAYNKDEVDNKLDGKSAIQIITWEDGD